MKHFENISHCFKTPLLLSASYTKASVILLFFPPQWTFVMLLRILFKQNFDIGVVMFTDLADLLHSNLCQKCGINLRCFDALLISCTLCNAIVENPTALSVERHYCFHPLATTRLNIPLIYTTSLHLIIEQYTCAATPQESTGKKKTVKSLHEQTKHLQTLFSNTVLCFVVYMVVSTFYTV